MTCSSLFLASRTTPERFCGKPGRPYCPEHRRLVDYLERLDWDFKEIEETHKTLCEDPPSQTSCCRSFA